MPTVRIPATEGGPGQCYLRSFMALVEFPEFGGQETVLIHGYPRFTGEGEHRGQKFGHAWLEAGPLVLDFSRDDPETGAEFRAILRDTYYQVGRIDPKECRRYTRARALELASKHDGQTMWHKPPKEALFAEPAA